APARACPCFLRFPHEPQERLRPERKLKPATLRIRPQPVHLHFHLKGELFGTRPNTRSNPKRSPVRSWRRLLSMHFRQDFVFPPRRRLPSRFRRLPHEHSTQYKISPVVGWPPACSITFHRPNISPGFNGMARVIVFVLPVPRAAFILSLHACSVLVSLWSECSKSNALPFSILSSR